MELLLPYCNFFLLLPLLLLLALYFLKTRKNGHHPPGPPRLPIIGNLHQLGKPMHQVLDELSKKYGPVMLLQLGRVPTLVISSPEAAKQILKTYDLQFCNRPSLAASKRLSYNHLDIASGTYGEYYREIRKICLLELFSTKRVQSFKTVRAEEMELLIDSLSSSSANSAPVDVIKKLTNFTHRTVFRIAFGSKKTGDHSRNELADSRLMEILDELMVGLTGFSASDFFPKVGWIIDRITGSHATIEKCFHDLDEFFQQMIDQHLDPERLKPDRDDIIDVLLKLDKDHQASKIRFTNNHIKAILMNVFVAGIDAPTVTMNWAMTELARNPEAMKKVQEEIRNYVGSKGKVEESDLDNFHYLKMVVKEALRMHAPAPLLSPRECIKNSKIDGYDVYPKTRVLINAWAMGRNPKYWKNPEEFMPERFKDSFNMDFAGTQNFEYVPFGAGRRICPGMNMGIVLTEFVLANILYAFDWKLPNGLKKEDINMEESSGISIHKKYPLELVPIKHMQG